MLGMKKVLPMAEKKSLQIAKPQKHNAQNVRNRDTAKEEGKPGWREPPRAARGAHPGSWQPPQAACGGGCPDHVLFRFVALS